MYVENVRVPEGLAIGRHPLIPRDELTLFVDFFEVSIQPALGRRSREFSEGRSVVADLVFDECGHKDEERSRKEGEGKEPKHLLGIGGIQGRFSYIAGMSSNQAVA